MLSRTASELYWLSRYLERAENMARMLDVSYSLSLMPQDGRGAGLDELAMPLMITGTLEDYQAQHGELDAERMLHFFALQESNPSSIYCCLKGARTNAHAVRGRITADMWENINSSWLEMRGIADQGLSQYGLSRFCEWVKERSHLFRGATYGTIVRGDAYSFLRLGVFLERADNTLRLLVSRYELLGDEADEQQDDSARDYYQWSALLKALSSYEAYTELYRDAPATSRVADMLLLRADVPRSLAACLEEVAQILAELPGHNGRAAQRLAAEMSARLRYTAIDELLEEGLQKWLTESIECVGQLGKTIQRAYLEAA